MDIPINSFYSDLSQNLTKEDVLYTYIIRLLQDIKLIQGPQAVYSTLRRHKDVHGFVITYLSDHMSTIDGMLADLDSM